MFTGIITHLGTVVRVDSHSLTLQSSLKKLTVGQSVAVNGVCLSVTSWVKNLVRFDVMPETFKLSNLGSLKPGELVNLETPLTLDDALSGHLVLGHVDGIGIVNKIFAEKNSKRMTVSVPNGLTKYIMKKGSITMNGVSLTVTRVSDRTCEVALIPLTLHDTNLGILTKGSSVNLEVDVLARYVERLLSAK